MNGILLCSIILFSDNNLVCYYYPIDYTTSVVVDTTKVQNFKQITTWKA